MARYNVFGYNNELKGQIEASNSTEAWEAARLMYLDILDVRPIEGSEGWVYAKIGTTEVRGRRIPSGIDIEQVSSTFNQDDFDEAVRIIEGKLAIYPHLYDRQVSLPDGQLVRLKSGTEGWVKGQIVEYFDLIPSVGGMIYSGPGYKVFVLEGKHKGDTIQVPANYVEAI